ncbi:MFS transporter [Rubrobacter tropicus]|uniref:MFS transporter n=1 Tax=Rubrobacter tropicus TaxID=2653851 RepID=A0A6G8Q6Q9_9ACTN|nr:MFS transporter [Rubrobacter tropicus]QIN82165.1 MFS transporter [Rubrobacter tropicus]
MRRPATTFLFVTVFVDMLGYGLVVPLLPFYAGGLANGAFLVGILGSLYAAMQFFGGPFLAGLSDRVGRRPVLVTCLLGASLAYALLGLAGTFAMVVVAVALAGAAAGTQATAQAFMADSTAPEDRAKGLGLLGAAFGLGLMAGPLLGGLLSLQSLQAPAFAASALALLNAAFGLFVLPESLPEGRRTRTALLRLDPFSGLVRTVRMGGTGPLLLAVFLLNLSFAGLLTNFPLFSGARFGWGAAENAFFFAFVGACAVLTQGGLVGRLQKLFGETRLAFGGLALTALSLALVGASPTGWLLYPVVGALAVGAGLAIPALTALLSRRAPAEEQGRLMGGVQAVLSLALISGPLMAGAAFDDLGVPAPYFIGAVLAALALPAVALSLPKGRTAPALDTDVGVPETGRVSGRT